MPNALAADLYFASVTKTATDYGPYISSHLFVGIGNSRMAETFASTGFTDPLPNFFPKVGYFGLSKLTLCQNQCK